ncbi:unnamed protein product [Closterium sp. Yama58-4]|nr:unnamed protein product [Closterium sp. Yama58-4]
MAMADQAAAKFPSYTPYCSAGPYVTAVLIPLGNCRAYPRGNNARIVRAGNSRFIRLDLGRPVRGCQRSYRFQLVNFRGRVVRGPVAGVLLLLLHTYGWSVAARNRRKSLDRLRSRRRASAAKQPQRATRKRGAQQPGEGTISADYGDGDGDGGGDGGVDPRGANSPSGNTTENAESSRCPHWPAVAVVMPVRGFHAHTASNWATHITADYAGPVEFLIVVESEADRAYQEACKFAARFNEAHKGGRGRGVEGMVQKQQEEVHLRKVRVVVAGTSTTCSQKIHNQLAGVAAARLEAEFVLFLDDDARMYPEAITYLVTDMLGRPDTFLVTGYPFDIPNPGPGSSNPPMLSPAYALLAHPLDPHLSARQFWSYLRRQLFTLTTHFSPLNRRLNLWLLLMGMAFSSVMTASIAISLVFLAKHVVPCVAGSAAPVLAGVQLVGSLWALARVFTLTMHFSPLNRSLNLWLLLMGVAFSSVMVGSITVSLSLLVQHLLPCMAGFAARGVQMVELLGAAAPVCKVPVVGVVCRVLPSSAAAVAATQIDVAAAGGATSAGTAAGAVTDASPACPSGLALAQANASCSILGGEISPGPAPSPAAAAAAAMAHHNKQHTRSLHEAAWSPPPPPSLTPSTHHHPPLPPPTRRLTSPAPPGLLCSRLSRPPFNDCCAYSDLPLSRPSGSNLARPCGCGGGG